MVITNFGWICFILASVANDLFVFKMIKQNHSFIFQLNHVKYLFLQMNLIEKLLIMLTTIPNAALAMHNT